MRVFAALPLSEAATQTINAALAALRSRYPRLRISKPGGIHLTLHFFGELEDEAVRTLESLWDGAELARPAIPASFGSLGQFPEKGNARVVWIGIEKGAEALAQYSALFQSKIAPLGYRQDPRGFTPHLTLARNSGVRVESEWIRAVAIPRVDFAFRELVLFRSILKPRGAEYIALKRITFTEETYAGR